MPAASGSSVSTHMGTLTTVTERTTHNKDMILDKTDSIIVYPPVLYSDTAYGSYVKNGDDPVAFPWPCKYHEPEDEWQIRYKPNIETTAHEKYMVGKDIRTPKETDAITGKESILISFEGGSVRLSGLGRADLEGEISYKGHTEAEYQGLRIQSDGDMAVHTTNGQRCTSTIKVIKT